jgi:hypothetical protein
MQPNKVAPRDRGNLEGVEREGDSRPPYLLTYAEVKLLGIAGVCGIDFSSFGPTHIHPKVGFFLDGKSPTK